MIRRVLMLMALSLAVPSAANAATVTLDGGVLRYQAQAGKVTNVTITQTGSAIPVTRITGVDDPLAINPACSPSTVTSVTCPSITSIGVDLGDKSDRVTASTEENGPNVLIAMSVD